MTKKVIEHIKNFVFKYYKNYIDDPDDMASEMVLCYHLAEQTYKKSQLSVEKWCWYKVHMKCKDYLRAKGKYIRNKSGDKLKRNVKTQFVYVDGLELNCRKGWDAISSQLIDGTSEKIETSQYIQECLGKLTSREREIVTLYYFYGYNQPIIGHLLGITNSRISQIHKEILKKLHKIMEKDNGNKSH